MRQRPIEEVADEALEKLLSGESLESILARYPEHAGELGTLLTTARTMQQAPRPQLPEASLAAILARAHAQASPRRNGRAVVVPPLLGGNEATEQLARGSGAPRSRPKSPAATSVPAEKVSLAGRIAAWLRMPGPLSSVPSAMALVLVVLLGVFVVVRSIQQEPDNVLPVPTISRQFSLDGSIEKIAGTMWVVGGSDVYLDNGTRIEGSPSVGSAAHIEGDITSDNRQLARLIRITGTVAATLTTEPTGGVEASATAWPTLPAIIGQATVPPAETQLPSTAATTRPTGAPATAQATRAILVPTTLPTEAAPTTIIPLVPTSTTVRTSNTAVPSGTNTPLPTNTSRTAPDNTATSAPQPQPIPPTPAPTDTPVVLPTPEPTFTTEPQPTTQPTTQPTREPTEPPEREETRTPEPPTAPPTIPPVPTQTAEPEGTETREPTQMPRPTGTTIPTQTIPPLPTQTEHPQETHTEEPSQTRTAQPTQTESHHGEQTHTPEPTHNAGQ